jgi:hypothetical protein
MARQGALDNLDGAVILEAKGTDQARALIEHVKGLSALPTGGQFEIQVQNEGGTEFILFTAHRRYRMPAFCLARAGRFLCIGVKKESVLALSRQGEARGNLSYLFGEQSAAALANSAQDLSARIAVSALYAGLTATLDAGTRRNLEPFAEQIRKVQALSLVRTRGAEGESRLLVNIRFSGELSLQDPFLDNSGESDPLLLILGVILIAVFLTPLLLLIIRKIRYR